MTLYRETVMSPHARLLRSLGIITLAAACGEPDVTSPAVRDAEIGTASVVSTEAVATTANSPLGWTMQAHGASQAAFGYASDGRAGQRLGSQGTWLLVGTAPADGALIRTERFAGTPLAALTTLGFSTYVAQRGRDGATPIMTIAIDLNDDGYVDDQLLFRPTPALGRWESWDALNGGWWSNSDIGAPDSHGIRTIAAYLHAAPNARLVSALTIGAWDVGGTQALVVDVDEVVVGVSDRATKFRFGTGTQHLQ